MIEYNDVIKESKAYKIVEQDAKQNRIAHSYMLISEDKETLDNFVAVMLQTIYCKKHEACGECDECLRLEHHNNPNVYFLKKDTSIKVDDIKELINDTAISAIEKNYKIYVICNAESMNEASQNKLLKTLEEPTEGVIIILAVQSESNMLQTIKSRVKKLYLNIWNNQNIAKELAKIDTNSQNIELAVKFSKGNLTLAKSLIADEKFKEYYNKMINLLTDYTSTSLIAGFVNHLGTDKDEMLYSLSVLEGIISSTIEDIINNIPNPLAITYNIATLANLTDLVVDTAKRLNSNCNPQAVATNFLLKIAEIKYLTAN